MVRIWGCALAAIVLDFVVLCPVGAQAAPLFNASEAPGFLKRPDISTLQARNRVNPNPSPNRTEGLAIDSVNSGTGSAIVLYVTAVELALAAIVAAACWLVLAFAGIWLRIDDSRRSQIPANTCATSRLQAVRRTSEMTSKAAIAVNSRDSRY